VPTKGTKWWGLGGKEKKKAKKAKIIIAHKVQKTNALKPWV
jgi:hypothetical protein